MLLTRLLFRGDDIHDFGNQLPTYLVSYSGKILEIFIAAKAGEPLVSIPSAHVVPQRGIEGDRYFTGIGSFSRWPGSGRAVSLIEAEVIAAIRRETGLDLSGGRSRRNIVTAGVRLSALNGRKFRIGSVLLRGARECAPCRYLERLIGIGLYEAIKGRGGLRADVLEEGTLAFGDEIYLIPTET